MRLALALISCAVPATAQDFLLQQPLDCDLGNTCYIQQFFDHDDTADVLNFQCSSLTYDDHGGTDFALPSLAAFETGVDILAAAGGTVLRTRDEMPDILFTTDRQDDIAGRECGNGVVIDHGDGWTTQYCHMRLGSITVQAGDTVQTGQSIGQVGLSGKTMFPHLHLTVSRDGVKVDPFDPDGVISCNQPDTQTLWAVEMPTPTGGLLSSGFAANVPTYDAVKAGTAHASELAPDAPIVLWAYMFGANAGDQVALSFSGPDGPLFQSEDILERTQALVFRAGGLNVPDGGWPSGQYTGMISMIRDGVTLDTQTATITLP